MGLTEPVKEETYEKVLITFSQADVMFAADIMKYSRGWLDRKYGKGNADGFMRNVDGGYQLFAVVKNID